MLDFGSPDRVQPLERVFGSVHPTGSALHRERGGRFFDQFSFWFPEEETAFQRGVSGARATPMMSAIEHKPPAQGLDVAFEYRFPVGRSEMDAVHISLLTAWFTRLLDNSPDTVGALLEEDWASEASPLVQRFVGYLSTLTPTSIVFCGERVWVVLRNPARDLETIMIHEPRAYSKEQEKFLSGFGVEGLKAFSERFYDTFEMLSPYTNGLSMEPRPISGDERPKLGSWEAGMELYHVCNGDMLILGRSGKVGRWSHEIAWGDAPGRESPVAVSTVAESFGQFVDLYTLQMKEDSVSEVFW